MRNTSGSWYLHSGKGVKVTESDEHSDEHIPRNKTLLIGGAAGGMPPAAVATHREMSQNQNQNQL